ncbi:hypothetical protein [Pedobacter sp. B4-66]|uniref:hypothetical protein n=1 Tax=Pedobacter sp. B4-66 TaxID=2817280 RepID=UPI001BD9B65F|nr:hypothetical protein [Pedobacter sp. B4-66]
MEINLASSELFKTGKYFDQVNFLDNFHHADLSKYTGKQLFEYLSEVISVNSNLFIKRSAFKVLCELFILKKIETRIQVLGLISCFLDENEMLQNIALKYLAHFTPIIDDDLLHKLKECSDSPNAEVASQAYICLGILELTKSINENTLTSPLNSLTDSSVYFKAATLSVENRVDADFYLTFIALIKSIIAFDESEFLGLLTELKTQLQGRILYELNQADLELEYLLYKLSENLIGLFKQSENANGWLEFRPNIQALFELKIQADQLSLTESTNRNLLYKYRLSIFEKLESKILSVNLKTEQQKLEKLKALTGCEELQNYITYLLSLYPDEQEPTEDLQMLALLSDSFGAKQGLEIYQSIKNKETTLIQAIGKMLKNEQSGTLPFRTGSIIGQQILFDLMKEIGTLLQNYPADKMEVFSNILEEVIRYTRVTLVDHDKARHQFLYSEQDGGKGQTALEADLQDSMILYFEHSKIADGLEHERAKFVDGGRVDILYKKDILTIPIELKRSLSQPDQASLEDNYIAQAQTYTSGYEQLGIFVLLELSDKSKLPPPNFKDWFRIHHLTPSSNLELRYPDYVVSIVIPGNRTLPSSKSTYK